MIKIEKLYKICFTMKPISTSFGGGNQFLNNLLEYLDDNTIEIVYDLNHNDIDIIFMMDPRKLTLNKITMDMVKKYKSEHPNVIVIHRINDCDKPRNHVNVLDPLILDALKNVDDHPVFVSNFSKEYFEEKGYVGKSSVILNGCNTGHFFPEKNKVKNEKIRIVTHHWSDNWNKGFEYYNALDEYITTHPEYEFTYIGRKYNEKYTPKNTTVIGPYAGMELGDLLRSHDLYITGAQYENCPMHVIEAMSCGLPILYNDQLGGGLELCSKSGTMYRNVDEMLQNLELMKSNLDKYRNNVDFNEMSSTACSKKYEDVIITMLLTKKYKVDNINGKPSWLKKLLLWAIRIEELNYNWSLRGYDNHKLGSVGLFAKISKILGNYYKFNKGEIMKHLENNYKDEKFVDVEKEIVSETRQALSGYINLGYQIPKVNMDEYFKEPLYFMNDNSWKNPWGAGAHLSHFLFFMKLEDNDTRIDNVLKDLKKYEHENGWYFGSPNKHYIVNGIMKIFTGFDIINFDLSETMANNILDYVLLIDDSFGGCGIYDYVYVLTKCMDYCKDETKLEKCKDKLRNVYKIILEHQQTDGGFKYDNSNDKAHKYYGENIIPDGMIGNIHSTTLFCMALSRLDKYLDLGLNLNMAIS